MTWRAVAGLTLTSTLALTVAGACSNGSAEPGDGRVQIVTTVSPITNIVANVTGDLADVTGVVPEGSNSHTFEPAPSVAEALADADVVFVNGLGLEEPTVELAEDNVRDGVEVVGLGDVSVPEKDWIFDFSFPKEGGKPNPHAWTDPTYAISYLNTVTAKLVLLDPDNADAYERNADRYRARLHDLDQAIRAATATLAPGRRKLLTYHDAYAYFARTYGWTVVGAIQVESFDDPTPKELAALIDQVKREGVPAVFGSEVFPSPVLEQIGREAGVRYVDVLRDDDLPGKPGDPEHSYLGLMRFDYATLVEALGGDATALRGLDVANIAPDRARYPQ